MTAVEAGGGTAGRGAGAITGILVGMVVGGALALALSAIGLGIHEAQPESSWMNDRIWATQEGAYFLALGLCALALVLVVVWCASVRRITLPRRLGIGVVASATAVTAFVLAVATEEPTWPSWPLAVSGSVFAAVAAALARLARWRLVRLPVTLTAAMVAATSAVIVVALPFRIYVPPYDLVEWWARHDNPPLAWWKPLSEVGSALERTPRDADAVRDACRRLEDAFWAFGGPPLAPSPVRPAVTEFAADLADVAERCQTEAATITTESMEAHLDAAVSSPAAGRVDAALNGT